ncbi:hypothetical protein IEO21_09380 [Rhodonia placenta]|uniref:PH domain-containing protein n=1 Tax=Rhodonia placenta TaxID=104341 RepID=A0A8H7NUJ2_9APHY|nr:hypothetical protein IEO21_09380 [Postia placenta]
MTSIPSGGSTSPRWDSRNQGFISPARLQQWKQQQQQQQQRPSHEFSPSPPPEKLPQSEEHLPAEKKSPAAPMSPPSSGHSRSLSAFSLFRIRSSNPEDISTSSPNKLQRPPPERRGSQNGFGKPVGTTQYGPVLPEKDVEPTNEAAPQSQASPVALSRFSSSSTASPMHPEIRSIVQLTLAHAHKIYFSGPLVKRVERQPDGQKPARDEGWRDVWAQLGGTTLSVWDMKAVEEASKQGKQVPPTYINVTDAFVNVLASVTVPETQLSPATKYSNVLTLNTAGSNLYLFACPASDALVSWTAALRLSAWEKSRLEEIYTAHLIRVTLSDDRRDIPTTLVHGRMEGWVRIRIAGQVDWKRAWMVVSAGGHTHDGSSVSSIDQSHRPGSPGSPGSSNGTRMKRMSNLFSRERSPPRPVKPIIQFLASPKSKDRKKPILTLRDITQAFAVYPERPELISRSTLIKLEGQLGDEEMGGAMKFRECWLMVLPELDGPNIQASEMLKWLIGEAVRENAKKRDADRIFQLYTTPSNCMEDLMLFLDRELAEALDVRDERTSSIRSQLQNILAGRMQGGDVGPPREDRPPILPPLPDVRSNDLHEEEEPVEVPVQAQRQKSRDHLSLQLPPLSFETSVSDSEPPAVPEKRILTPITERSIPRRSLSTEKQTSNALRTFSSPPKVVESSQESGSMLGQTLVSSPTASSPPPENDIRGRRSEDSYVYVGPGSRPSSRLSRPEPGRLASKSSISYATTPPSAPPIKVPMSPESDTRSFTSVQAMSPQAPPPPTSASKPPAPVKDTPSRPTTPAALNAPSSAPSPPVVRAGDAPRPPSHATSNPPPASPPTRPPQSPRSDSDDLSHSAGAMYYMQQMDQEKRHVATGYQRHPPPPVSKSQSEDEETSSDDSHLYAPPPRMTASPMNVRHTSPPRPPASDRPLTSRRDTNRSVASSRSNLTASESATSATTSRSAMGRKPSGARAAPASKMPTRTRQSFTPDRSPQDLDEVDGEDDMVDLRDDPPAVARAREALEDPNADALAALTFLEQGEGTDVASQPNPSSPPAGSSSPPIPQVVEPPSSSSKSREYRSSFAPSRQAAERKAKAQAQQAAQQAAATNSQSRRVGREQ